jgi:hypothetical protein
MEASEGQPTEAPRGRSTEAEVVEVGPQGWAVGGAESGRPTWLGPTVAPQGAGRYWCIEGQWDEAAWGSVERGRMARGELSGDSVRSWPAVASPCGGR